MSNPTILVILVSIPLAAGVITGLASDLVTQAEDVSNKTLEYTQQMNDALDCAFKGVELSVCSPDLVTTDFDEDVDEFEKTLEEVKKQTNSTLKRIETKTSY